MKSSLATIKEASEHLTESQNTLTKLQADTKGFQELSVLLREYAGINLTLSAKNHSLMATRMMSVLKTFKLDGYKEFIKLLHSGDARAKHEFVMALTTNTTHFFRENAHFDFLSKQIPLILERKRKSHNLELRVWCSAASTGQEVFTILMSILESGKELLNGFSIKFLATDIDTQVLKKCCEAKYTEKEIEGIPSMLLQKYFKKISVGNDVYYKVISELQNYVRFAQFNLIDPQYPFKHQFDIIFCRNVLIYFESKQASEVVDKMVNVLSPGGLLFLGHSESGTMKSKKVKTLSHAVYEKLPSIVG